MKELTQDDLRMLEHDIATSQMGQCELNTLLEHFTNSNWGLQSRPLQEFIDGAEAMTTEELTELSEKYRVLAEKQ